MDGWIVITVPIFILFVNFCKYFNNNKNNNKSKKDIPITGRGGL
jgi:hypothetical protein